MARPADTYRAARRNAARIAMRNEMGWKSRFRDIWADMQAQPHPHRDKAAYNAATRRGARV